MSSCFNTVINCAEKHSVITLSFIGNFCKNQKIARIVFIKIFLKKAKVFVSAKKSYTDCN